MALKPDRVEHLTDLSFFMNETGDRGKIVTYNVAAAASGAAMDDANAKVNSPTGSVAADFQKPAGLLLNEIQLLEVVSFIRYACVFQQDNAGGFLSRTSSDIRLDGVFKLHYHSVNCSILLHKVSV